MPSGFLRTIAGPADADFAVTSDARGELRYWPSFDGKREPLIIPARAAVDMAVLRLGERIAIASLDPLGQLELIQIAVDGTVIARSDVVLARPVAQIVAAERGFVALLDDQTIVGIVDGKLSAISPDPGVRVTALLERSGHVLALFDGKRVRGQMIELEDNIAWGTRTAALPIDREGLFLSPDAKRLAGTRDELAIVVDLATGVRVAHAALVNDGNGSPHVVAWKDDRTVWIAASDVTYDWSIERVEPDALLVDMPTAHVSAHAMVALDQQALTVYAKGKARHLGYRLGMITDLVAASDGWVATDGLQVVRFDRELRWKRDYPRFLAEGGGVALVDARHVVHPTHVTEEKLFTLDPNDAGSAMPIDGFSFKFERSTGIAMNTDATRAVFAKWDPRHGVFGDRVATFSLGTNSVEIPELYNPSLANGAVAEVISVLDYSKFVDTKIRSIEFGAYDPFAVSSKPFVPEIMPNFDEPSDDIQAMLPKRGMAVSSTDHTLIAELSDGRMSLYDRDGNVRWLRTSRGAVGLAWSDDHQLVAFGSGLALVDQETGDFIAPRCGWHFGLWTDAIVAPGGAGMCTNGDPRFDTPFVPDVREDETP